VKKPFRDMSPGTEVAYTGKFLRDSGQMAGSAGLDKFIVQECHCKHCVSKNRVAVNKPSVWTDPEEPGYDEQYALELKADVGNTWMHVSVECLYVVGQLDSRNSQ
jgi:ATP-dependent phosphoenolpyruvate carboxykinase